MQVSDDVMKRVTTIEIEIEGLIQGLLRRFNLKLFIFALSIPWRFGLFDFVAWNDGCGWWLEFMGFPFVDPFEEAQRKKGEEAAAAELLGRGTSEEGGTTSGGSKESTPGGEGGTGATKPKKTKARKGVIKVHQVQVDEVPGTGICPDPYY